MNENFKEESESQSQDASGDIIIILRKMQQQLTFLEKKVDTLLSQSGGGQSSDRPFRRGFSKPFSKPFRSFSPGGDRGRERSGNDNRGGFENRERPSFSPGGRPFEKRQGGDDQRGGFGGPKKKPFFKRKNRGQ